MTMRGITGDGLRRHAWASAAGGTVLVALLLPLLHDPRYFFYGDTQGAYYGWWFHLGDQLRSGSWPVVDPHAWRAGNIAAEGQWGIWSPLVIGIGLLSTVSDNVLAFATCVKIGLAVTGALGVFALARSYRVGRPAAYVAAVAVPLGGMTRYLDLPSWAAALMIWALLPWVWWALRRTMLAGRNPLPALLLVYLLVTVGYVYGTIMLGLVLLACLVDCRLARDTGAARRVVGIGGFGALVAVTVYLPGVLSVMVTVRDSGFGGWGGKFTTDPVAMFTSILPTASVHGTSAHLLPYAYAAWFLPVVAWLDFPALRRAWRPLAGLLLLTGVTFVLVDGMARFGPLRWPLRLQPFLVQGLVLLTVVLLSRFLVRRPSPQRLALSLAWVLLAGVVAVVRAPTVWAGHLVGVAVVSGGIALLWTVLRRMTRPAALAAATTGVVSLALLGVQYASFPTPPSPQRNMPFLRSGYETQLSSAKGDVMVVGDSGSLVETRPASTGTFLIGSAWYLNPHAVQNTYTTISFKAYYNRYCMHYDGSTCPELLDTLFSTEPTTGRRRVDLLAVSTLLLVRRDFPEARLESPPAGWHVADRNRFGVTWVRDHPVPTAGGPVWSSPGTHVSVAGSTDRQVRFRVDHVPEGGGRVVLSRVAWPGYRSDVGEVGDPVDGYLVSVDVPANAAGRTLTVSFSPPGWALELSCWWLAVLAGLGWSGLSAVRSRGLQQVRGRPRSTVCCSGGRRHSGRAIRGSLHTECDSIAVIENPGARTSRVPPDVPPST